MLFAIKGGLSFSSILYLSQFSNFDLYVLVLFYCIHLQSLLMLYFLEWHFHHFKMSSNFVLKFLLFNYCHYRFFVFFFPITVCILKEIKPEYSLEGLIMKLKLQYFGHLIWRVDSLAKILLLGKIGGRKSRRWQRMRWVDGPSLTQWTWVWANSGRQWRTAKPIEYYSP